MAHLLIILYFLLSHHAALTTYPLVHYPPPHHHHHHHHLQLSNSSSSPGAMSGSAGEITNISSGGGIVCPMSYPCPHMTPAHSLPAIPGSPNKMPAMFHLGSSSTSSTTSTTNTSSAVCQPPQQQQRDNSPTALEPVLAPFASPASAPPLRAVVGIPVSGAYCGEHYPVCPNHQYNTVPDNMMALAARQREGKTVRLLDSLCSSAVLHCVLILFHTCFQVDGQWERKLRH